MKKLFKKLALAVVALLTFSVGSNYTVKEVRAAEEVVATFDFGANGEETHSDGSEMDASTELYTDGTYTLQFSSCTKVYKNARDAKGNSCLKLGTSSAIGQFVFTAPDNVTSVMFYVAKYKAKSTKIVINEGVSQSIDTSSDNGEYTSIKIDTSINKNVTFATVSNYSRCMINTVEFYSDDSVVVDQEQINFNKIASYETTFSLAFNYSLSYVKEEISESNIERTLDFSTTANRKSSSNEQQVWEQNDVRLTYNKAGYNSNLADYSNPIRLYANTEVIIEGPSLISKIVFVANASKYASALQTSLSSLTNVSCTVTVEGNNVTVTFEESVESFQFNPSAQVRLNSLSITCSGSGFIEKLDNEMYSDVRILFGTEVDSYLFDGYTVSGGILIDNAANYTETTIAEAYENGTFNGVTTLNQSLSIIEDEDGNKFYSVGSVIEVIKGEVTAQNKEYLEYEFVAAAYFTLTNSKGSTTIVLKQKPYSVKDMVAYYDEHASNLGLDENQVKAIGAFNDFIVAA